MTKKTDIIKRRKELLEAIENDTFSEEQFLTKHRITERTIRRDLHALAEQGAIFEGRLNILRKICLGKLTKKVHDEELSDSMMLQIVLSGVAQKQEIKTELSAKLDITKQLDELIQLTDDEE